MCLFLQRFNLERGHFDEKLQLPGHDFTKESTVLQQQEKEKFISAEICLCYYWIQTLTST